MTGQFAFYHAGVVILLAMILGGGTQQGLWSDHLIQIAMLPSLFLGLPQLFANRLTIGARILALLILAVIVAQFIPVHREIHAGGKAISAGWAVFSPLPGASLEGGLYAISLLGFALFLARMNDEMQQRCLRFIAMGFIVNLAAGAIQLSFDQREAVSGILPFEITAGLFANENHFCAQIYAMIPLIAYLCLSRDRRMGAYFLFVGLIVALLFATGSRAGMAIAAALGVLCLAWFLSPRQAFAVKAALLAACVPLIAAALWVAQPNVLRQDQRVTFFSNTATAIGDHWLTGSGLGSFAEIYAGYEVAGDITRTHANHAHNEYLEVVLETGIAGGLLIALFCAIIAANGGRSPLAQAAFISVMALMLHSALDYPLRTYGVAVPFTWMVVVIASTRGAGEAARRRVGVQSPDFVGMEAKPI